jgi:D-alanine-D-alanine ligase
MTTQPAITHARPDASTAPASTIAVLVLGGGPDAEREVSLNSSQQVALACQRAGLNTHREVIDAINADQLRALINSARQSSPDINRVVVFPVLHGGWGEGGPLQDLLDTAQRDGLCAFVGCGPSAARLAMDKLATKILAARLALPVCMGASVNPRDQRSPIAFPVVLKPVHEGSSVGVRFARDQSEYTLAIASIREELREHPYRAYMVEEAVLGGRELTVGVLDGKPLEPVEIVPESAFYDYHAKYQSDKTRYTVAPELPKGVREAIQINAASLFHAMGCRHLARIDFLLGADGIARVLEANTMPGFTDHSLLPMAAKHAGLSFETLCDTLVRLALRDHTSYS